MKMKKFLALVMALIMLVSAVPTQAFAAGRYGSNLGWEYADVTEKSNGGYSLSDPSGSNHLGSHVKVTYSGSPNTTWEEGRNGRKDGILSSSSSESVTITCDYGYYIEWVVLACADNNRNDNPFNCRTVASDNGMGWATASSTPTSVTLNIKDIYAHANHDSSDDAYYLMIEIKPIANVVYVGYDSGKAGSTAISATPVDETGTLADGAKQVDAFPTWAYSTVGLTAAPQHAALGISAAAEAEANALGYSFAGWHLEYYTVYTASSNSFSGSMTVGGTNLPEGTKVELTVHAKLTAIWQPMEQIELEKVWSGTDNHPESVTVNILKNGVDSGMDVTLSAANGWKAVINVPSKDENGNDITYTVSEDVPAGFACTISAVTPSSSDYEYSFQLTNAPIITSEAGHVLLTGQKIWEDDNNAGGHRPGSIVVILYADGQEIARQTVTGPNWTYSFDVSHIANADDVVFTIAEESVPNYILSNVTHPDVTFVDPTTAGGWSKVTPCSVLEYQNTASGKSIVAAKMTRDGTVVIWSYDPLAEFERELIIASLEAGANGLGNPKQYVFISGEGASSEYGITVNSHQLLFGATSMWSMFFTGIYSRGSSSATASSLTNTLADVTIVATKIWEDDHDRDGIRPDSITVQLYADGTATGDPIVLNDGNNWSAQWTGLPEYGSNGEIAYTVQETSVPDGYSVDYSIDEHTGALVITNTHTVATTSVTATKVWNDNDDQDGIRPDSVVLTLYANGVSTGKTVTVSEANGWKAEITNLPLNENGVAITYTFVEESAPNGYTASTNGTTVTNTHTPETTQISFNKVWNDGNNQDGTRPHSVTIRLYANGTEVAVKTITEQDNWKGIFANLPKYLDGAAVTYTISEDPVAKYTTVITGSAADGYTVTNSYTPEVTSLHIQKVWDDGNNQDGKRPDAVIVTLYANGQPMEPAMTLTLQAGNNWSGGWENMPRFQNGQRISYTVVETGYIIDDVTYSGVPEGYTVTHSYDTSDTHNGKATVTNTYTPESTKLNVQKVWDDDDNRDGKRPSAVTVTLWRKVEGGEWAPVKNASGQNITAQLSPANEWDVTFLNLPKYEDGKAITYNAVEDQVDGYDAPKYDFDAKTGVVTITNSRTVERTNIHVSKVWEDENNQDNLRPAGVVVRLYANGIATSETVTLNAENNWSHTWSNLYAFYHGKNIVYTVEEENVPTGYTATITGTEATGFTVTNTHTPAKTSVSVNKVWNDQNDQDGIRPGSITVTLYANGVSTGRTMTLNASNNWHGTFSNLDVYQAGTEVIYTVGEETVPTGYTAEVTGTAATGFTVTNTHEVEKVSITAEKVWNDNDNQDGKRPAQIVLHLEANGEHTGKKVTLSDETGWTYTWSDLDKFAEGKEINYTVYEEPIGNGYTASYNRVSDDKVIITNSRNTEKTGFTVQKIWVDANNQDNIRPESIQVQLYANGSACGDPVTLNTANHWRYNWTNLDVNDDGEEIVYTVKEIGTCDGYTIGEAVQDTQTGVWTITNTHEVYTTEITVSKIWDDADNQDGKRPTEIEVTLFKNGEVFETVKLTENNGWTYTWKNLDVHHGIGVDNVYTVEETNVPEGYTPNVNGFEITNSYETETLSIPVHKEWNDNNDQDGIRPDTITIDLYADGEKIDSLVLSPKNNWAGAFTDLPKFKAGEVGAEIVYTIAEASVPEGYEASAPVLNEETGVWSITNTHIPAVVDRYVRKVWNDNNNQDGKRHYAVVVVLLANGREVSGSSVVLNAANNWSATWKALPRYQNGQRISYSVVETGYYHTVVDADNGNFSDIANSPYTVEHTYDTSDPNHPVAVVTNSYTPESTSLNVQKAWHDDDNRDGIRPASITVTLQRRVGNGDWADVVGTDGKTVTAVLTPGNEWDVTFTNLPKYEAQQPISYRVVEAPVEGYTQGDSYFDNVNGVIILKNIHEVERVNVSVSKVWNDNNNQDGLRTDSVQVRLYANGIATSEIVTLNAENHWSYTWENLYGYYHGSKIVYTVVEENAPEGYTAAVTGTQEDGYVVTNTHVPYVLDIPVSKVWNDNNNQDGIRPATVTVTLHADGAEVASLILSADNSWSGSFTSLPVMANGQEITYTLTETVPEGYEAQISGSSESGFTVTNTHQVEKTHLTVNKVWDDNNDQDGLRPASVTIHLLADGVHTQQQITLSEENGWKHTWTGLDKYAAGKLIHYTVSEEPIVFDSATNNGIAAQDINGYADSYNYISATEVTVTNTYIPEITDYSAQKIWDDDNNRDGVRPATVTVELYADGQPTGQTETLSEANGWFAIWDNLPKYRDHGKLIVYSVVETVGGVAYESDVVASTTIPGLYEITNSHTPATVTVDVSKVWDDTNDQDGFRPDSVQVTLYANDVPYETVTLDESNGWHYSWTLFKYESGKEIVYTVAEEPVPTGYNVKVEGSVEEGFVITNTHEPILITVPVYKVWDDNDNQDGIRPESIVATLYADGQAIDSLELNACNNWEGEFANLPMFRDGGIEILYAVAENTAPEGYTPSVSDSVITNTHEPATVTVDVSKVWDDADNQDGLRPDSVEVTLYADTVAYETVTLDASNGWSYSWTLFKYENGREIVYTVAEESVPTGYDAKVEGSVEEGFVVTNTHEPIRISVPVSKVWDDNNNQDGIRPESIVATLYADGKTLDSLELSADNNWEGEFVDLPMYRDGGTEIIYTVAEHTTPEGYIPSVNGSVITNTHEPEQTSVKAQKVWQDDDNRSGARPAALTLHLLADGEDTGLTVTISAEDHWTYEWTGLDKYAEGVEINYTVYETPVGNGYSTAYSTAADGTVVITNTRDTDKTSYSVQKVWNDNHNQDGIRPYGVAVQLYADGQPCGEVVILSANNHWSHSWSGLELHAEGAVAQEIVYTVAEVYYVDAEGNHIALDALDYTTAVPKLDEELGVVMITNTHKVYKTEVSVAKSWIDENNRDGIRPASVEITLLRNGIPMDTVTLSQRNGWKHTWTDLDVHYGEGKTNIYTVVELPIPYGYAATITGTAETGYLVTNIHLIDQICIPVTKVWKDSNNQDGIRPETITAVLYADGRVADSMILSEANGWSGVFTNLPKNREGKVGEPIVYTVAELTVPDGYTASVDGTVITNTHEVYKTDVSVEKEWIDDNNRDGIRPTSVEIALLRNGVPMDTVILSEANGWNHTWTDLDVHYGEGKTNIYTVVESSVPDGYTATISGTAATGYLVTNSHSIDQISVPVTKVWNDGNNQDGIRPETITAVLYADGTMVNSMILGEANGWSGVFTNLPKNREGKVGERIIYTVAELTVPDGYTVSIEGSVITNTHIPETLDLDVEKIWNDADNNDGKRPYAVEVTLFINGKASQQVIILTEDNDWTGSWTDLPMYHAGARFAYTVVETGYYMTEEDLEEGNLTAGICEGYTVSYNCDASDPNHLTLAVTNAYSPETTGLNVLKVWTDDDNRDGVRPETITVTLLQKIGDGEWTEVIDENGNAVTATLNADGQWAASFTDLPKYADGELISYKVTETAVDGYTTTYSQLDLITNVMTIHNTRTVATTELTVNKVWADENNQDGIRPDSITVSLLANGTEIATALLNEANQWSHSWTGLFKFEDGAEILYTVEEVVPEGYTAAYTTANTETGTQWTVTNTHEPATKDVTISKVWVDNNNAEKLRTDSVTIQVYKNGEAYHNVIVLSEANGWQLTAALPVYENGEEIKWTVAELNIPRYYTASYDQNTLTVTNTIQSTEVPKTGDSADLMFWTGMMLLLSTGAAALFLLERKRNLSKA